MSNHDHHLGTQAASPHSAGTLVPMLIWGLVLIVLGMTAVMLLA